MKKINITLFNNHNYDVADYEEEFKFNFQESGLNEKNFTIHDFISQCLSDEWDDFKLNLKHSKNNLPCVIIGSLGVWNGVKCILPKKCHSLLEAVETCIGSCDGLIVKQICGHLEIDAIHHDGRNYFAIYLLNDKGIETMFGDLSNKRYHKSMQGYVF